MHDCDDTDGESIASIIAKHDVEPSLRSVYVEGPNDKDLLDKMIKHHKLHNVRAYDVDNVDLTRLNFNQWNLSPKSKRDKVTALMLELESQVEGAQIKGVIDRDYDEYSGAKSPNVRNLNLTDWSCMECYCISDQNSIDLIKKISRNLSQEKIEKTIISVSYKYDITVVNLSYKMKLIDDWTSYFNGAVFNYKDYIRNSIIRAGLVKKINLDEIISRVDAIASCQRDIRFRINGHDLMQAFVFVLRKHKKSSSPSISCPEILRTCLYFSMNLGEAIDKWPLFKNTLQDRSSGQ